VHARGAGGHAGEARQAAVDVLDGLLVRRPAVLQHVLDQVDPPARAVELVAQHLVGRAGRGAEAAMHAGAQDLVRPRDRRVAQLLGGEIGLHAGSQAATGARRPSPGFRMPRGSNFARSPPSAATGAGAGVEHAQRALRRPRRAPASHARRRAASAARRSASSSGTSSPDQPAAPVVDRPARRQGGAPRRPVAGRTATRQTAPARRRTPPRRAPPPRPPAPRRPAPCRSARAPPAPSRGRRPRPRSPPAAAASAAGPPADAPRRSPRRAPVSRGHRRDRRPAAAPPAPASPRLGLGSTLKATSVSTPSVPWLPAISFTRS
jgi:hypothetical protein